MAYAPPPIPEEFKNPQLLALIHIEINKKHLHDDKEKLTNFLVACTAYQPDPRDRKSVADIGDSSVGKDNIMDAVLHHFPEEDVLKVTNATQATLEDDIAKYKIIRISEVNAGREKGANNHLVEAIKQLAEGGMSSFKKDLKKGLKEVLHAKQEQKTVFFSTTESRRDDELETRFLTISIRKSRIKTRAVNIDTLNKWADPRAKREARKQWSWIREGIKNLKPRQVVIPYANLLYDIFDTDDPRSQRDVKRIMALTAAHAWLYQLQRPQWYDGNEYWIISHPVDFINVFKIAGNFFNMTYKGLESRMQDILDAIEELSGGDWGVSVLRLDIEKKTGVAKNTIKDRLKYLRDNHYVEVDADRSTNNGIYYRRCQTGCQKLLMDVNLSEIKKLLQSFDIKSVDTLDTPKTPCLTGWDKGEKAEIDTEKFSQAEGVKIDNNKDKDVNDARAPPSTSCSHDFDTHKLTPLHFSLADGYRGVCASCGEVKVREFKDNNGDLWCRECKEEATTIEVFP